MATSVNSTANVQRPAVNSALGEVKSTAQMMGSAVVGGLVLGGVGWAVAHGGKAITSLGQGMQYLGSWGNTSRALVGIPIQRFLNYGVCKVVGEQDSSSLAGKSIQLWTSGAAFSLSAPIYDALLNFSTNSSNVVIDASNFSVSNATSVSASAGGVNYLNYVPFGLLFSLMTMQVVLIGMDILAQWQASELVQELQQLNQTIKQIEENKNPEQRAALQNKVIERLVHIRDECTNLKRMGSKNSVAEVERSMHQQMQQMQQALLNRELDGYEALARDLLKPFAAAEGEALRKDASEKALAALAQLQLQFQGQTAPLIKERVAKISRDLAGIIKG